MDELDPGLLGELFRGVRQCLKPEYQGWSAQRFLQNAGKRVLPPGFGIEPSLSLQLGQIQPSDNVSAWAIVQLFARAMGNGNRLQLQYKSVPWGLSLEELPVRWFERFKLVLRKRDSAFPLALCPDAGSRIVAKVLVERCGYRRDWDRDEKEWAFWNDLTCLLMEEKPKSLDDALSAAEIREIKTAVQQFGFERAWLRGYSSDLFGVSGASELYRLAWALSVRGMVPRRRDDPQRIGVQAFWAAFMHESYPMALMDLLHADLAQMPLLAMDEGAPFLAWVASRRMSIPAGVLRVA